MSQEIMPVEFDVGGPGCERYQYRLLIFNPETGEERYIGHEFVPKEKEP
jgi:hypothetical protein